MTNFDIPVNRRDTQSVKWSGLLTDDVIPFCIADADFPVAQPIIAAITARAQHGIFGYTRYSDELHAIICAWIARRYHWTIDPSWISMNQGVVTSLCTAVRALSREGDTVLIQTPVYHPFFTAIRNNQRVVVENPLVLENGHYRMDFDLFAQQVKTAKLFILCNPHNPVGRVWTADELLRIGQICLEHGVTVISDDIHADFAFAHPYCPFASLHADFAAHTVTCLSPSKTFNIAGLSTSYEIIPDAALREKIRHEKAGGGIGHPNLFGLLALEQAYRACDDWLDELLQYLAASRALLREYLHPLANITLVETEGTYLAWLDCRQLGQTSEALTKYLLDHAQVRLVSGRIFGAAGEGFLRLNYATHHARLATGLARIVEAVKSFGR